jgi:putative transposase
MTPNKANVKASGAKSLVAADHDFLRAMVEELVQDVLDAEMDDTVWARRYERSSERRGMRSGYYRRDLITRVGTLELRVPQARDGRFSTQVFERYQRSEKALVSALAEMYVQGVSTRKVKAITEELCGHSFSASSISDINKKLDEQLKAFASRRLEEKYQGIREPAPRGEIPVPDHRRPV